MLTDDRYTVLTRLVEDPAQATEAVWPDAIVSLPFAVTPEINQGTAGAQFPGVLGPGAIPPPARLGSEMLHYTWRLEEVTLRDVTDEADKLSGPGTPPAGQLAAQWQLPRDGVGGSAVAELQLLSTGGDLWLNRLIDGGASLPGNPLKHSADLCQAEVPNPAPGWAVGFLAVPQAPGFWLPPDPVSADPRVSRVEARLHSLALRQGVGQLPDGALEFPLDTIRVLPDAYTLQPANVVAWPAPQDLGRRFDGYLLAPSLSWIPGAPPQAAAEFGGFGEQEIRLELTEPIRAGQLVLVVPPVAAPVDVPPGLAFGLHVWSGDGTEWTDARTVALPAGETAVLVTAPNAGPVDAIAVVFPLGLALGIAGVGGVTESAAAAVRLERTLLAAQVTRQAAAAAGPPPPNPPGGTHQPEHRTILDPGRLYRLDVAMTWAGQLARQDKSGQITVADKHDYTKGDKPTKHLFFRTAEKATTAPPSVGAPEYLSYLRRAQTEFRPEMLERYLAGYEPTQSEEFRFCDDPLRAHFLQDHVAALAAVYGYTIAVAVRRVDRPGVELYHQPRRAPARRPDPIRVRSHLPLLRAKARQHGDRGGPAARASRLVRGLRARARHRGRLRGRRPAWRHLPHLPLA